MTLLRLLAMLWLFYVTARILRSLRDSVGQRPTNRSGQAGQAGHGETPFGDYGPFGRFGPFGPFGPFGQQNQQGHRPRNAGNPRDPFGGAGWYGPFAGGDPFAGAQQSAGSAGAPPPPPAQPVSKTPYEILGVRPGAPMDEIRRAYQELVRQYHPDRLDGLGAELRELAERRTKEITGAYNQLKRRN